MFMIFCIQYWQNIGRMSRFAIMVSMMNLILLSSQLVPNRKSNLLQSPLGVEISADQRIAAAYNKTHLCTYNALTGSSYSIQKTQYQVVSLEFGPDSNVLAVGLKDGTIKLMQFKSENGEVSQRLVRKLSYAKAADELSIIADICWSAKSEALVIAHEDGNIHAWFPQGLVATGYFSSGKPSKVACSPDKAGQFAIGGISSSQNKVVIQYYKIETTNLTIEAQQITLETGNLTRLNYLKIDKDNSLYVIGDSNNVYSYTPPLYNMTVYYEGVGQLFKIQFGANNRILALANSTHLIIRDNTQLAHPGLLESTNYYQVKNHIFSLAASGTRLLYIDELGAARYLSKCPEGEFYNTTSNGCMACSSSCAVCHSNPSICYQCSQSYYLSELACMKCGDHCTSCTLNNNCNKCEDTFVLNQQMICSCEQGNSLIDGVCKHQRGIQIWVFAVVVGGASLLLCLLAAVNIVIMRRRQQNKHNLLENQNDQN